MSYAKIDARTASKHFISGVNTLNNYSIKLVGSVNLIYLQHARVYLQLFCCTVIIEDITNY